MNSPTRKCSNATDKRPTLVTPLPSTQSSYSSDGINWCRGCENPNESCHENIFSTMLSNSMVDHFEKDGIRNYYDASIMTHYQLVYTMCLRFHGLRQYGFYDNSPSFQIPKCMEQGLLAFAKQVAKVKKSLNSMERKRRGNVVSTMMRKKRKRNEDGDDDCGDE